MTDVDIDVISAGVARACGGDVAIAYIYGSVARRGFGNDLDVAVVPALTRTGAWEFERTIATRIEREVPHLSADVHVLEGLPLSLRAAIVREGIVVVGAALPERIDLEVRTLIEYEDYAPYERELRHALVSRLRAKAPRG